MGDLIDRQAAIDALHMHLMYRMGTDSNKKRLDDWINGVPSAQPEPESISKWKKEFREYADSLDIARDDWKGIIEYIDELPSVQSEPRTAYWTKDIVGSVVCSNCGGIREDNRIGHTQWCNCCGCFMRGEP